MRNLTIMLCAFILIYLGSAAFALEMDLDKFMPVDEIKPGMRGIGKTVFEGTRIEEFQVEILSVDKNGNGPKSDIIWALCSGDPLDETGILRGMSGSPIYINGRLIGAVAYAFSFIKKPIAGVTPIVDMLGIFEDEQNASPTEHSELTDMLFPEQARGMFYGKQTAKSSQIFQVQRRWTFSHLLCRFRCQLRCPVFIPEPLVRCPLY